MPATTLTTQKRRTTPSLATGTSTSTGSALTGSASTTGSTSTTGGTSRLPNTLSGAGDINLQTNPPQTGYVDPTTHGGNPQDPAMTQEYFNEQKFSEVPGLERTTEDTGLNYEGQVNQLWDDVMANLAESAANREGQFAGIMSSAGRRAAELGPTGGGQQAAQLQAGVESGREIAEIQRQDALHQAEVTMTMLQQRLSQAEAEKDRELQVYLQELIQETQLRMAAIEAGAEDPGEGVLQGEQPLSEQYEGVTFGPIEADRPNVGMSAYDQAVANGLIVFELPAGVESQSPSGNPYTITDEEGTVTYHYDPATGNWYRQKKNDYRVETDQAKIVQLEQQRR